MGDAFEFQYTWGRELSGKFASKKLIKAFFLGTTLFPLFEKGCLNHKHQFRFIRSYSLIKQNYFS